MISTSPSNPTFSSDVVIVNLTHPILELPLESLHFLNNWLGIPFTDNNNTTHIHTPYSTGILMCFYHHHSYHYTQQSSLVLIYIKLFLVHSFHILKHILLDLFSDVVVPYSRLEPTDVSEFYFVITRPIYFDTT